MDRAPRRPQVKGQEGGSPRPQVGTSCNRGDPPSSTRHQLQDVPIVPGVTGCGLLTLTVGQNSTTSTLPPARCALRAVPCPTFPPSLLPRTPLPAIPPARNASVDLCYTAPLAFARNSSRFVRRPTCVIKRVCITVYA